MNTAKRALAALGVVVLAAFTCIRVMQRMRATPAARSSRYCSESRDRYPTSEGHNHACPDEYAAFRGSTAQCIDACFTQGELDQAVHNACLAHCGASFRAPLPHRGDSFERAIPSGEAVRAIVGTATDDAWALGAGVYHYDGVSWSAVETPVRQVAAISAPEWNDVWIVGDKSRVAHFNGKKWTEVAVDTNREWWSLRAVFAWPSGEVWIADDKQVTQFDGKKWSKIGELPLGIDVKAMWGAHPRDVWFATAYAPIHWDGQKWDVAPPLDEPMHAIAGTTSKNIWMVGAHGAVAHWDGKAWTMQRLAGAPDLTGVATTRAHRAVAVGDGAIASFDGSWRFTPVSECYAAVFAFPFTDDVVLGGNLGARVIHVH